MKQKFPSIRKDMSTAEKILWLVDSKSRTPSELAKLVKVTRSTVSEHLIKFVKAKMMTAEKKGKTRVYSVR